MNAQGVYPANSSFDGHQLNGSGIQAMSYRSGSTSMTPSSVTLKSPPPTAQKPAIPPQRK